MTTVLTAVSEPVRRMAGAIRSRPQRWWAMTLGFATAYHLLILLATMVRFGNVPNFVTGYNWLGNVRVILASTPSWRDAARIVSEEWLLEVGYMNYDFGNGIAEWSLFLVPTRMIGVLLLGALLATQVALRCDRDGHCNRFGRHAARLGSGVGAIGVAVSSITLSWVVCCSTPTWVVGLAMMGLGVSTALWLEPLGNWLMAGGFVLLLASTYALAATGGPRCGTVKRATLVRR